MLHRLFSVSNEFSRKCILSSQNNLSSHPFFKLENLSSAKKLEVSTVALNENLEKLNKFLQPFVSDIEEHICQSLKIDLKTLEKINKYFESSHKKNFHAKTMLLIAKACGGILKDHETFAQVIEMTYFGSVLHSNLRENEDLNESKIFGEKGKILGGDFMISNAAILCCTVDNLRLIQLLCVIVQNFSRSNFSGTPESDPRSSFLRRIYLKDVSMLAYACQGIALLSNSDEDAAFAYGAHFALAHKLVNDIKASRLNKENKDNKDKTQQSPLSFPAFFGESVDQSMLKSEQLAKLHIEAAFNLSSKFQNSSDLELWASSLQVKLSY